MRSSPIESRRHSIRAPRLAQVDAAVEELLDHLQLEQVLVGVEPLRSAATRLGERRAAKASPVPVVQLAVGDADNAAHLRPAETDLVHLVPLSLGPELPSLPSNGRQHGSYTLVSKVSGACGSTSTTGRAIAAEKGRTSTAA